MQKDIPLTPESTSEGVLFDVDRAKAQGLYEEMQVQVFQNTEYPVDVDVTPELFEAIQKQFDLGVNVEPGQSQHIKLNVSYIYDYGKPEEAAS